MITMKEAESYARAKGQLLQLGNQYPKHSRERVSIAQSIKAMRHVWFELFYAWGIKLDQ